MQCENVLDMFLTSSILASPAMSMQSTGISMLPLPVFGYRWGEKQEEEEEDGDDEEREFVIMI